MPDQRTPEVFHCHCVCNSNGANFAVRDDGNADFGMINIMMLEPVDGIVDEIGRMAVAKSSGYPNIFRRVSSGANMKAIPRLSMRVLKRYWVCRITAAASYGFGFPPARAGERAQRIEQDTQFCRCLLPARSEGEVPQHGPLQLAAVSSSRRGHQRSRRAVSPSPETQAEYSP